PPPAPARPPTAPPGGAFARSPCPRGAGRRRDGASRIARARRAEPGGHASSGPVAHSGSEGDLGGDADRCNRTVRRVADGPRGGARPSAVVPGPIVGRLDSPRRPRGRFAGDLR